MPNPPRTRFQIHLSTAIVMMVVAGALMWANTRTSEVAQYFVNEDSSTPLMVTQNIDRFGWPFEAAHRITDDLGSDIVEYEGVQWIVGDLALVLLIIFTTWFLCEWIIRRRAAQKRS